MSARRYTVDGRTLTREERSALNVARFRAGLPTLGQSTAKALKADGIKATRKPAPAKKAARKAESTGFMKAYIKARTAGYTGTQAEFGVLFEMGQIAS